MDQPPLQLSDDVLASSLARYSAGEGEDPASAEPSTEAAARAQDANPRRRSHVRQACNTCQRSKIRCDGKQPCARCQRLKRVCEYREQAPRGRKPGQQQQQQQQQRQQQQQEGAQAPAPSTSDLASQVAQLAAELRMMKEVMEQQQQIIQQQQQQQQQYPQAQAEIQPPPQMHGLQQLQPQDLQGVVPAPMGVGPQFSSAQPGLLMPTVHPENSVMPLPLPHVLDEVMGPEMPPMEDMLQNVSAPLEVPLPMSLVCDLSSEASDEERRRLYDVFFGTFNEMLPVADPELRHNQSVQNPTTDDEHFVFFAVMALILRLEQRHEESSDYLGKANALVDGVTAGPSSRLLLSGLMVLMMASLAHGRLPDVRALHEHVRKVAAELNLPIEDPMFLASQVVRKLATIDPHRSRRQMEARLGRSLGLRDLMSAEALPLPPMLSDEMPTIGKFKQLNMTIRELVGRQTAGIWEVRYVMVDAMTCTLAMIATGMTAETAEEILELMDALASLTMTYNSGGVMSIVIQACLRGISAQILFLLGRKDLALASVREFLRMVEANEVMMRYSTPMLFGIMMHASGVLVKLGALTELRKVHERAVIFSRVWSFTQPMVMWLGIVIAGIQNFASDSPAAPRPAAAPQEALAPTPPFGFT